MQTFEEWWDAIGLFPGLMSHKDVAEAAWNAGVKAVRADLLAPSSCGQTFSDGTPHPKSCWITYDPGITKPGYCRICVSEAKLRDEVARLQSEWRGRERYYQKLINDARDAVYEIKRELTALREGLLDMANRFREMASTLPAESVVADDLNFRASDLEALAASGRQR